MNALQKIVQKALGIRPSMTPQQIREAEKLTNKYYAALQYLGVGPIWHDDKEDSYIKYGYAKNPDVYAVVSAIAQKASELDVKICIKNKYGEEEEILEHELLDRLYSPNDQQSKLDFIEQIAGYLMLTGNSYIYTQAPEDGPNAGKPIGMYVLPSQFTDVVGGNYFEPISGYEISLWRGGDYQKFGKDEIIHLKNAQYMYGEGQERYGMSPIRAAWNSVQTGNSGYEANKKGLDNMGPPGVLFDKGNGMEQTFLEADQQKNLEDKFRKMSGTSNSGTIAVTSGNLDYINFGLSAIDLAIMDTLKMTLLDVCNIYHVPSQLFNSEVGKTYTNLKEARQQMYTDAVLPLANKVYSKISKSLIPRYKDLKAKNAYLKVVTSNVPELQADMKELAEWLDKAWYLTPNEARQKMSFDPIEDEMMDEVYINASRVPLSMSGMQPEAMASKVNADSLNDK